uniref:Prenyl transferase n=1 Tax=Sporolithon durum TaxID=48970 RepID=A0A141SCR8_9FLOR|nr:prenyl transferase [Sporolithon durum]AMK96086.1 prenyl transferase [Sporolithon durum]
MFSQIKLDLKILDSNLKKMIGARHPILYAAAEHLFDAGGKKIRPAIVLLVSKATNTNNKIKNEHKRLAEITEIIHTASLVHDDVIDDCDTRRGIQTVHNTFSNKIAILAGDFLFAQASWYLANLDNLEVVKIISKVITDFAEGEVMQGITNFDTSISIEDYVEKSFYKTASLIAASCKAAVMINHVDENTQRIFYNYGKHIGLAFQIMDDILDITGSETSLGKPAGSDLKNGNLTSPLIFALHNQPELIKLIDREFQEDGDQKKAVELIHRTHAIEKAKDLAIEHAQASLQYLKTYQHNDFIDTLKYISNYIINRIH